MNNLKFPPIQFVFFRIIFGFYLFIHFACLIPLSNNFWNNKGIFGDATIKFSDGNFLNFLTYFNSLPQIKAFIVVMTILSLLIMLGIYRRIAAILLCYGWFCLYFQNNLISILNIAMIWWLLLSLILIPSNELSSFSKKNGGDKWFMPPIIFWSAWWFAGIIYLISGIYQLIESCGPDGYHSVVLVPQSLDNEGVISKFIYYMPIMMSGLFLGIAVLIEIFFGLFSIFKKTRQFAWFLIMGMQIGNLIFIGNFDLTIGVMMIHFFTFDPQWFQPKSKLGEKKVVLFDGVCGLCNGFVNFLLANDLNNELYFSPLQGNFAKDKMDASAIEKMESVVFYYKGTKYTKSKAAILILRQLGGMWVFIDLFLIIPKFMRDFFYDLIAKNRYKIFGKHEICRIPTLEERAQFID